MTQIEEMEKDNALAAELLSQRGEPARDFEEVAAEWNMNLEEYLDEEFRLMRVDPHITHIKFLQESRYSVVTVASQYPMPYIDQERRFGVIMLDYQHEVKRHDIGKYIIDAYASCGCGVALCHWKDQFDRQRGRIISKGRLFKVLRQERMK